MRLKVPIARVSNDDHKPICDAVDWSSMVLVDPEAITSGLAMRFNAKVILRQGQQYGIPHQSGEA